MNNNVNSDIVVFIDVLQCDQVTVVVKPQVGMIAKQI